MSNRDFAEDRRICDAATEGPWWRKRGNVYASNDEMVMRLPPMPRGYGGVDASEYLNIRDGNANFTAEARTGWPAALDEIQTQAVEIERLRSYVQKLDGYIHVNTSIITELSAENQHYKQALESIAGLTISMFASIEDLAKHAKKTAREVLD